jgi:lysophospholipase L1-like esterase
MPGVGTGTGQWRGRNAIAAPPIWRGMGQSMRMVEGFNGGANRATTSRIPIHSPVPFRYLRLVFPVFRPTGASIADTLFAGPQAVLRYQAGLEYPYAQATSGIAPRIPVLFDGATHAVYDAASWNPAGGVIVSDVIDMGRMIPAGSPVGIWTTAELPAGSYNNALPYGWVASNFVQRFIGQVMATTALTLTGGGVADFALTSPTITAVGAAQAGVTGVVMPCMALVQTTAASRCVALIGDSKMKGIGEGNIGSGSLGDVWGDAQGNRGMAERGFYRNTPGTTVFNLAQGSDGFRFQYLANAFRYRLQVLALGNPTHAVLGYAHNDLPLTTLAPAWAAGATYVRGSAVTVTGAGVYACTQGGTSAGSGPGPSGTGTGIVDGGCQWSYLDADQSGEGLRVAVMKARAIEVARMIRAASPGIRVIGLKAEPAVSLVANGGASPAIDQTVLAGFGGATSRRGRWNAWLDTPQAKQMLGLNGMLNTSALIEFQGAGTSKWDHAGLANRYTSDGIHPNSTGYEAIAGAVTPSLVA